MGTPPRIAWPYPEWIIVAAVVVVELAVASVEGSGNSRAEEVFQFWPLVRRNNTPGVPEW